MMPDSEMRRNQRIPHRRGMRSKNSTYDGVMKILVIGGTLFIGREIVRRLATRGHDVTVLHRRDRHDLGSGIKNIQADRGDLPAIARVLRDGRFEAVFDVAYDWGKGTTANQVEAAARACGTDLQRYVFVSSIAAYGPGLQLRESAALVPDDYPNPYGQHKASSERALFHMHAESGFPATTFRPPFVHGPRQPFYREQFFWDRLQDGRPIVLPDGGDTPMQWVFVSDLAEACVRSLEVPDAAGEAFNIAHTESLTQRTFVEILARIAGRKPTFATIPRATIQAAGGQLIGGNLYFGEFLDLPAHITVIEKAPRILGVTPTNLDTALGEGFAWYQQQPRRHGDYTFEDRLLAGRRVGH
jgi:nucleoside-diphosphate-sugar epimerase